MRVRMLASVSGTVDGHSLPPKGHEVDLPDHVAADLCGSGHAVPVATHGDVETAAAPVVDVEERADGEPTGSAKKSQRSRPADQR